MQKLSISILLVFAFSKACFSQSISADHWNEVSKQTFEDSRYKERHVSFLLPKSKNLVVRYNPVTLTMSSLLFLYQKVISVQISSGCSYELSCSEFSKQSIREFGLIKGMALSADRLSRCNQLAARDVTISDLDFKNQKVKDDLSKYRWSH
jgi:putative component of membrane protein insertase Oxa1/YidC/SpoIIIJ protein YidD